MSTKLFVGSLSWNTTDQMLQDFFSSAGAVVSAKVIMDRQTGRSRGFGFVEYGTEEEAQKAVQELNGKELDGRQISVNEARPQENRGGGNFHGGRGGGGGGYRDDRRQGRDDQY
jgi:cold-inducible RNA-binding protein